MLKEIQFSLCINEPSLFSGELVRGIYFSFLLFDTYPVSGLDTRITLWSHFVEEVVRNLVRAAQ